MANSRLERLGTIYSRVTGLMKAKALNPDERPLWYDLYEAFPPEVEPKVGLPLPTTPIRQIFYAEDQIRAKFHKNHQNLVKSVKLDDFVNPSSTQELLEIFKTLKKEKPEESEEKLFESAVDVLKTKLPLISEPYVSTASQSIVSSFTEAKKKDNASKIDIKSIFNEQ